MLPELGAERRDGHRATGLLEGCEHGSGRTTGSLVDAAGRRGEGAEAGRHALVQPGVGGWIIHGK